MKKKPTKETILNAYNILSQSKLGKMDEAGKFAVIRTLRPLKGVATALQDYEKDARERLKPDNYDELVAKAQKFDTLPDEEKRELNRQLGEYDTQVRKCIADELASEAEVDIVPLDEAAFGAFMAANEGLDANALLAVDELFCSE